MRPLKNMIPLAEAQQKIDAQIQLIDQTEEIPLLALNGRVLAEDIVASMNVPPFRRAAMDGYAVKTNSIESASESNPILLKCIDKVLAGDVSTKKIGDLECIEIATGAMIPDGADCVVQVELTQSNGQEISIFKALKLHTNIMAEGADIKKGHTILKKGELITPGRIGVLASLNLSRAPVYKKPKVALIPTGREIASLGEKASPSQIYDINSYTLYTTVTQFGGEPLLFPIIPDEFGALEKAVLDASFNADIIIIIAGSSAGERDINIDVLQKHGTIIFHGVQIKPGKPTICAMVNQKLVLNLPGFPTSCLTNGYLMLVPIIRKMAHLPNEIRKIRAPLAQRANSTPGRDLILTVKVENGLVVPTFKESGAITSIARADGYILVPYTVEFIEKGTEVEVTFF